MGAIQTISAADAAPAEPEPVSGSDASSEIALESVDRIIESAEPLRRWPDAIRSRYQETVTKRFYQEQHFLFMLGLLSCLATIAVDYLIAPSVARDGFVYRVLAVCPITLVGLYAASRRWTILTKICMTAAPSAFIAVLVVLAVNLPPENTAQYLTATPLIVGLANIVMPYTMRELVLFNAALIVTAATALVLGSPFPLVAYLDYLVLLTVVALSTLPIALRFERLRQRNFVLNLRSTMTSEKLLQANERLRALSERDPLTGLPNRRCFERVFEEMVEQRLWANTTDGKPQGRIAVLMIDLDHFKAFNDTHGHQAGDGCLRLVGHELGSLLDKAGGVAARYGGEEFVAAVYEEALGDIGRVAEEVRHRISTMLVPVGPSGKSIVTTSIGIALAPMDGEVNREDLIETADAALYNAKRAGRNRVKAIEIDSPVGACA
ncbi:GGDEF domain-containing protein [uncultured Erythrobacter sp.]|uniref:GGDEF domain-containing protein n=1 Tax=uncultured Erythrobacter sp. TaxID=263913 RepID=UPI002635FD9E|nr:GGDEF domain-containing protein [uncultured Erythrobacter sp.]